MIIYEINKTIRGKCFQKYSERKKKFKVRIRKTRKNKKEKETNPIRKILITRYFELG